MGINTLKHSGKQIWQKSDIHILLIENEPDSIQAMQKALSRAPISVELYALPDIKLASEYLRHEYEKEKNAKTSMILLGTSLPVKEGQEFLKNLKSESRYSKILVAALATDNQTENVQNTYAGSATKILGNINTLDGITSAVDLVVRAWFESTKDVFVGKTVS